MDKNKNSNLSNTKNKDFEFYKKDLPLALSRYLQQNANIFLRGILLFQITLFYHYYLQGLIFYED